MKNKGYLYFLVGLVLGVAVMFPYSSSKAKEVNGENTEEKGLLNKINYTQYKSLLAESNENLVLIARPTCGYCVKFIPVLEEIIEEYNITINYLNTDDFTSAEGSEFNSSDPLFTSSEFGTPTLLITKDNKIVKYTIGYQEKAQTISWLQSNGILQ